MLSLTLVSLYESIKDIYLSHPFTIIFSAVLIIFCVVSITLVTIVAGDPSNHASSPTDEERSLFLPSSDSLCSPSAESTCSELELDSRFMRREGKVSESIVEGLLAAHRDRTGGRFSDEYWNQRTYFEVDPNDVLEPYKDGEESEDDDSVDAPGTHSQVHRWHSSPRV